jgi:hypothetical protein
MAIIQSHLLLYILVFLCSFAVKDTLYLMLSRINGPQSIKIYSLYTMLLVCLMVYKQKMAADYFRGTFLIPGPPTVKSETQKEAPN